MPERKKTAAKKTTAKAAPRKTAAPKRTSAKASAPEPAAPRSGGPKPPAPTAAAPRPAPAPATAEKAPLEVCPRCGTTTFGPEQRIRAEGTRTVRYTVLVCERGHTFARPTRRTA